MISFSGKGLGCPHRFVFGTGITSQAEAVATLAGAARGSETAARQPGTLPPLAALAPPLAAYLPPLTRSAEKCPCDPQRPRVS